MVFFDEIYVAATMTIMFVTSFLMLAFSGVLYFVAKRRKGILFLFLSNVMQVIIAVLIYAEDNTGNAVFLMISSICTVLLVTLWIHAIFYIMKLSLNFSCFIIVNSVNVVQAVALYFILGNNNLLNIISTFLIVFVMFFCVYKILKSRTKHNKRESFHVSSILFVFGFINLGRALYRIRYPLYAGTLSKLDSLGAFLIIISVGFSFVINFLILFLVFNELLRKLEDLSSTDSLTGVLMRGYFYAFLEQRLASIKRGGSSIAVAFIDIDDFKRINDKYGHQTGDDVLRKFAETVKSRMRDNDLIGRIGGEEFVLLLEAGDDEGAMAALKRIKDDIANSKWIVDEKITFSCGHILIDKQNSSLDIAEIIGIADANMYKAKALGKNRIV